MLVQLLEACGSTCSGDRSVGINLFTRFVVRSSLNAPWERVDCTPTCVALIQRWRRLVQPIVVSLADRPVQTL